MVDTDELLVKRAFMGAALRPAVQAARTHRPGRSGLSALLFGQGHLVDIAPAKRVVDSWGGVDNTVGEANRAARSLEAVGVKVPPNALNRPGDMDVSASRAISEALPYGPLSNRSARALAQDPAARAQHLANLAQHGIKMRDEQYVRALGDVTNLGNTLSVPLDLFAGHKPIDAITQRYRQGGLIGKGGVLTSDLIPDADVRRGWTDTLSAAGRGDWTRAAKSAPLLSTGLYGAGAYYGYVQPLNDAADAFDRAGATGQPAGANVAAALTRGAAGMATTPLNFAWGLAQPRVDSAINAAFGVDPSALYRTPQRPTQPAASAIPGR